MPAIITHHLFGEQSATLLPEGMVSTEEELLAFLLGNQGPDPFFFRVLGTPDTVKAAQKLAHNMHEEKMFEAFSVLRDCVSHLPKRDAELGRAFALGMLSHYALDRVAHPFVYAQEYALMDANQDLASAGNQVHAVIESDLDTWMLWQKRHATVIECPPTSELVYTERILQVAGAMLSHVAWAVFGLAVPPSGYGTAVKQMSLCYKVIEPYGSIGSNGLGVLERAVNEHSLIQSLAHKVSKSNECPAANLDRQVWVNPWTHDGSNESFMDLFDKAAEGWPALALAFTHGGEELKGAIAGLNYSGNPVEC